MKVKVRKHKEWYEEAEVELPIFYSFNASSDNGDTNVYYRRVSERNGMLVETSIREYFYRHTLTYEFQVTQHPTLNVKALEPDEMNYERITESEFLTMVGRAQAFIATNVK